MHNLQFHNPFVSRLSCHSPNSPFYRLCKITNNAALYKQIGILFVVKITERRFLTMAFIDYYKIMGISKDTPQKDIKAAYKKRAKQFHPDLHPNDPKAKAKFQALNEAYDVLNDPDKRAHYDQYGEHWKQMNMAEGATHGGESGFEGFDFNQFGNGGFSSFFTQMFGGDRAGAHSFNGNFGGSFNPFGSHQGQPVPTDREYTVDIDMYTALLGGEIIVQTPGKDKLKLKIKPGTQPGAKVRLKGKGDLNADGTRGNMILVFNVQLPTHLTNRQKDLLQQMRNG